MKSKTHWSI